MPLKLREWIDLEDVHADAWNAAIEALFVSRPLGPVPCPICATGEFRYFYLRNPNNPAYRNGAWYWCHGCWRFMHGSSRMPKWWRDVSGVAPEMLIPQPIYLDEHWHEIFAVQLGFGS